MANTLVHGLVIFTTLAFVAYILKGMIARGL